MQGRHRSQTQRLFSAECSGLITGISETCDPQMCSLTLATESIIPCLWLPEYLLSVVWRQSRCFDWQSLWSHHAYTLHDQRLLKKKRSSPPDVPVNLSLQTFSISLHPSVSDSDLKTPFYSVVMQQTLTVAAISLFCKSKLGWLFVMEINVISTSPLFHFFQILSQFFITVLTFLRTWFIPFF